jgi:16S rRNA (cytosine967-C5)-methyltransferase
LQYIWQHAATIAEVYTGSEPLANFLKKYFAGYKQLGSRDRRVLSDMLYSWYRCSKGFEDGAAFQQVVLCCLSLCKRGNTLAILGFPDYQQTLGFDLQKLCGSVPKLSGGLSVEVWLTSMLQLPELFIRVRKDHERIGRILQDNNISYEAITDSCWQLPNGAAIDKLLPPDAYVVQDLSSQLTGNFFEPKARQKWLDCCCGAGGKALLLVDKEPKVQLTACDVRPSITQNLQTRFRRYGLPVPRVLIADMSGSGGASRELFNGSFDGIICDVPCSGSGTWARTPEQLYFFNAPKLEGYATRQRQILDQAALLAKAGGYIYYITCSAFSVENEEVATMQHKGLKLLSSQIINGIDKKADCMFIAELQRL